MGVLQEIYKKHLDSTCGIGYEPRIVRVPLNGRVYAFQFDKPDSLVPLKDSEMVEGVRTVSVDASMSLPEAWRLLSRLNGIRFHSTDFHFSETEDSRVYGRVERIMGKRFKRLTKEGDCYSAHREEINFLVEALDKASRTPPTEEPFKKVVDSIWIARHIPVVTSEGSDAVSVYEFRDELEHDAKEAMELMGDLEKAIIAPK